MKTKTGLFGAAVAAGFAVLSTGAFAAVICDSDGDCWHATESYTYPSDAHVVIHPDNWRWGSDDHYTWREHQGRGFWRHGEWEGF